MTGTQLEQSQQRVVIGEIVGSHGLKGEVRVRVLSDGPDPFHRTKALWLGLGPDDPQARRVRVSSCGPGRKGEVRLRLEGVRRRDDVTPLVGQLAMAKATELPELPSGEYYWYELIGCLVESETGEVAGTVREIWETGAHDVLVVEDDRGQRRLIPTASELMKHVDLAARRIVVADLPGLLEPL
jgi:16S rRNA processing protein RimM